MRTWSFLRLPSAQAAAIFRSNAQIPLIRTVGSEEMWTASLREVMSGLHEAGVSLPSSASLMWFARTMALVTPGVTLGGNRVLGWSKEVTGVRWVTAVVIRPSDCIATPLSKYSVCDPTAPCTTVGIQLPAPAGGVNGSGGRIR